MNTSACVKYAILGAMLAALAMFATAATASTAATLRAEQMSIRVTDSGLVTNAEAPQGGLYVVTIRNDTRNTRGIVMKGLDRGGSRYIRFTKVLKPGAEQQFRWYFPNDKTVMVRDLMHCTHAKFTCVAAGYGAMTTSVHFG